MSAAVQVGSTGQDVVSALAVDGGAAGGDVVICGSTSGGMFDDPANGNGNGSGNGFAFESGGGGGAGGGEGVAGEGETEAFCAKLAASDGRVSRATTFWGFCWSFLSFLGLHLAQRRRRRCRYCCYGWCCYL